METEMMIARGSCGDSGVMISAEEGDGDDGPCVGRLTYQG